MTRSRLARRSAWLYESDDLTGFIAAVLGKPVLYRSADPLDALEIAIIGDGDDLGWHFDNSEFSVTVMYQQPQAGGHFDYYPRLRDEHDQNYPGVQQILHGGFGRRHPAARQPRHARDIPRPARPAPGHPDQRAAPADQLDADHGEHPGMKVNELTQKLSYGRTASPPDLDARPPDRHRANPPRRTARCALLKSKH